MSKAKVNQPQPKAAIDDFTQPGTALVSDFPKISATAATRQAGERILNRYELVEFAGHGGMGEVWKALDTQLLPDKIHYALKFLPSEVLHDQRQREHVRACYVKCKDLKHLGICEIRYLEVDPTHGMFIVMPFIDGVDLDKYRELLLEKLREEDPAVHSPGGLLPVRTVTELLRPIAEGLDYLHSGHQPLIHRDVKPGNIRVSLDGKERKLVDHGIAAEIRSEMTRSQTAQAMHFAGTPLYMAPEAYRNYPLDSRSDQYSFAVVVYEFLCGRLPFEHISFETFKHLLLHEPPRTIRGLNTWAMSILEKALSKEPSIRYSSCTEFLSELERAGDGILTYEVAREYINTMRDKDKREEAQHSLNRYTTIETEAARHLANEGTDLLDLSGLETLEPEAAAELGRFNGRLLLDGLKAFPEVATKALVYANHLYSASAKEVDYELSLNALEKLENAEILSFWMSMSRGKLVLNGIKSLSAEKASQLIFQDCEKLVRRRSTLVLDGIKYLDHATAEVLGNHCSNLSLMGLVNPDAYVVKLLAECMGWREEVLTALPPEAARALVNARKIQFEAEPDVSICLPRVTSLTVEAAEILAEFPGRIELKGLIVASPEVVVALCRDTGTLLLGDLCGWSTFAKELLPLVGKIEAPTDGLSVDRLDTSQRSRISTELTSLSNGAAQNMAKLKGPLFLNGITCLSDTVAEKLAAHDGELFLNGLTSLSDSVAERLAKHSDILCLNGLTSLSGAVAERLARHEGTLLLDGLARLPDDAAEGLGKRCGPLYLDGLTSLSYSTAERLAKHTGELSLGGITNLPASIARYLRGHKGGLFLDGLTSLPDISAIILANDTTGGLSLDGLTTLSESIAVRLARHQDGLSLNGLRSLSDSVAEALVSHEGWLYLDGLTSLSDSVAEKLSRKTYALSLNGLTTLSGSAAVRLVGYNCLLRLNGLTSLSKSVAKKLARHRDVLELKGLTSLSDDALASLVKNPNIRLPERFVNAASNSTKT